MADKIYVISCRQDLADIGMDRVRSAVEGLDEVEIALLQLLGDAGKPYYVAMQIRRAELKEYENRRNEKLAKWKSRMKMIIGGLMLGLILLLLKLSLFP